MLVHVIWDRLVEVPRLSLLLAGTSVAVAPAELDAGVGLVFVALGWGDEDWLRSGRRLNDHGLE
jgi:hypothetical protein